MKIKGMRWGMDNGGFACGPIDGSAIVEVCFDNDGKDLFVTDMLFEVYEHFYVSEGSMFEDLMKYDPEAAETKIDRAIENFEYSMDGDTTEETAEVMNASAYLQEVRFVRMAMDAFDPEKDNNKTAKTFIKAYIGKDTKDMTFDVPSYEKEALELYDYDCEDEEEDED